MKITLGNGEESETNVYVHRLAGSTWFCFSRNALPWMGIWFGKCPLRHIRKESWAALSLK